MKDDLLNVKEGLGQAQAMRKQSRKAALLFTGLGIAALIAFLIAVGQGAVAIEIGQILSILGHQFGLKLPWVFDPTQQTILLSIRLPRVCLGVLVGAALAAAGAALQGLFRNPLADPGLIGVSTGAALSAAVVIVLGVVPDTLANYTLPLAAFLGGLGATVIVYQIATREGRTEVTLMLLAGIALNAIAGAFLGFLIFYSDDQQLRELNFWLLGSLASASWETLLPAAPLMLIPALGLTLFARHLNAFLLGETDAFHLGFNVEAAKRWIVILSALTVGASVALTGVIGFIGLVVPHLIRMMYGSDHRVLLPASMLLGATLLLVADLLARTLILPAELPIGILTSCIGGPFFLWLLIRQRGKESW